MAAHGKGEGKRDLIKTTVNICVPLPILSFTAQKFLLTPQVYIPCILFVTVSWISFIIDPKVGKVYNIVQKLQLQSPMHAATRGKREWNWWEEEQVVISSHVGWIR
jgi:hypothetical protein